MRACRIAAALLLAWAPCGAQVELYTESFDDGARGWITVGGPAAWTAAVSPSSCPASPSSG